MYTRSGEIDIRTNLLDHGWYQVTQNKYVDEMFDSKLSYPSEDYIFHPCVVEGKNPITGFGNLFYEDIYKPLYALGLAWDFNDPPDNLVLGSHPSTSIGDLQK